MIQFHFNNDAVQDIKKLAKKVEKVHDKLQDRSEPLQKIKARQIKRWAMNFNQQGAIYGKWAPLATSYTQVQDKKYRRRLRRANRKPLFDTGDLYHHFIDVNNEGVVTNDAINWNMGSGGDSNGMYAIYHHGGISPNRGLGGGLGDVPARTLWDINNEDEDAAQDIMQSWVDRILTRYFGAE